MRPHLVLPAAGPLQSSGVKKGLRRLREAHGGTRFRHPGGRLRELGAESLSEEELLAVLIGTGTPGRSAQLIARDVVARFGGLRQLAGQPLERLLAVKGLGDVKILRIAAALEIARRVAAETSRG